MSRLVVLWGTAPLQPRGVRDLARGLLGLLQNAADLPASPKSDSNRVPTRRLTFERPSGAADSGDPMSGRDRRSRSPSASTDRSGTVACQEHGVTELQIAPGTGRRRKETECPI